MSFIPWQPQVLPVLLMYTLSILNGMLYIPFICVCVCVHLSVMLYIYIFNVSAFLLSCSCPKSIRSSLHIKVLLGRTFPFTSHRHVKDVTVGDLGSCRRFHHSDACSSLDSTPRDPFSTEDCMWRCVCVSLFVWIWWREGGRGGGWGCTLDDWTTMIAAVWANQQASTMPPDS